MRRRPAAVSASGGLWEPLTVLDAARAAANISAREFALFAPDPPRFSRLDPLCLVSMVASPSLTRLLVLHDGEVHATFSDHTAVIINHTAATLAFACADGSITSNLARCVLSHNRAKATQALHARNTLCLDAPRLQWELLPPDRAVHYFDTAKRPLSVSWPSVPSEALRHPDGSVRVVSLDGLAWLLLHPRQHVFAVCFPAPAEAAPEQMVEHVDPTQPQPQASALAVDALRSVFCTQLHSATDDVPSSWQHALRLALEAARTLPMPSGGAATGDGWVAAADLLFVGPAAAALPTDGRPLRAVRSMVAPLPGGVDASLPRSAGDAGVSVPLPQPGDGIAARQAASAARAEWRLSTDVDALQAVSATALSTWLPKRGARLVLSPYALVRLVRPAEAASNEWRLSLMRLDDDAQLELSANGRFWDAGAADDDHGDGGPGEAGGAAEGAPRRVYAAGAVPPTLRCGAAPKAAAAKPLVALGALASCCEQLLREVRRLPRAAGAAAGAADASDAAVDATAAAEAASTLLGEAEVDGVGRFRKFGDGRLIGSFVDRAVVTMLPPTLATAARRAADAPVPGVGDAAAHGGGGRGGVKFRWYLARVIFPDGRTTQVRSDCPVGAEAYVDAMLQFDGWASRTPQQRLEYESQRRGHAAALHAEVSRISSHLAVSAAVTGEPPPLEAMGLAAADGAATSTPAMPAGAGRVSEELRRLEHALRPARADGPPPASAAAATSAAAQPASSAEGPRYSRACVADELQRISQFLQASA